MSNEKSKNYSFKRKNLNESYKATVVPINSPTAILLPPDERRQHHHRRSFCKPYAAANC